MIHLLLLGYRSENPKCMYITRIADYLDWINKTVARGSRPSMTLGLVQDVDQRFPHQFLV